MSDPNPPPTPSSPDAAGGQGASVTSAGTNRVSPDKQFGGCEVLGEAPLERVRTLPAPATGRYVMALGPPGLDGWAHLRGEVRQVPSRPRLALLWRNNRGVEVLHDLCAGDLLLWDCAQDATWLPEGWTVAVFPAGWTPAHLEAWFDYALSSARNDDFSNARGDIPHDSDKSSPYAPTPRELVTHAHLIVRHLGFPNAAAELRVPMDRAGCLAELRDVREFLRRATATASGALDRRPGSAPPAVEATACHDVPAPQGAGRGQAGPRADGTPRGKRGTVNQRMLEHLHREPESANWSQLRWAAFLGCQPSAVAKAPGWKSVKAARAVAVVDRLDRPRG